MFPIFFIAILRYSSYLEFYIYEVFKTNGSGVTWKYGKNGLFGTPLDHPFTDFTEIINTYSKYIDAPFNQLTEGYEQDYLDQPIDAVRPIVWTPFFKPHSSDDLDL